MNLKTFQCYRIPHPFKKDRPVIISDNKTRASIRDCTWEFLNGKTVVKPKVLSFLISPDKASSTGEYNEYLKTIKLKEERAFNRVKLKECMRFLRSLLIGYLLYIAPPAFWEPIETVFDSVAHGMSDYAKLWVILFFPVKGLIRTFGTGFHFPLPQIITRNRIIRKLPLLGRMRHFGTIGRWQRISLKR